MNAYTFFIINNMFFEKQIFLLFFIKYQIFTQENFKI